jgi:hypothetical protein
MRVFIGVEVDVPTVDAAVAAFDRADLGQLKAELTSLHEQLLFRLHVVDPNLGKCYDLGRALVYTCQRPSNWTEVRGQFQRFRLATLSGWLADVSTYLPDHACRAVAISLGIWQEAIPDPGERAHAGQLALDLEGEAEKAVAPAAAPPERVVAERAHRGEGPAPDARRRRLRRRDREVGEARVSPAVLVAHVLSGPDRARGWRRRHLRHP